MYGLYNTTVYIFKKYFQITKFAQSVCALVHQVCQFVSVTNQSKVIEEWQEFFSSSIFPILLGIFVDIASSSNLTIADKEPLLCNLGKNYSKDPSNRVGPIKRVGCYIKKYFLLNKNIWKNS